MLAKKKLNIIRRLINNCHKRLSVTFFNPFFFNAANKIELFFEGKKKKILKKIFQKKKEKKILFSLFFLRIRNGKQNSYRLDKNLFARVNKIGI